MMPNYTPRVAFLISAWIDGDTAHGTIDRGWGDRWTPPRGLRLVKIDGVKFDAPEMHVEPERAQAAWKRAKELAPEGNWYYIVSYHYDPDSFGRPLCSIELPFTPAAGVLHGTDLATQLALEGHSK